MTKLILTAAAAAALPRGLPRCPRAGAGPQRSRVNEIIVYGTDPCPRSTDDEVVVCARRPESERFRIPESAARSAARSRRARPGPSSAERFETVGSTGINSCSPVGPGGLHRLPAAGDQPGLPRAARGSRGRAPPAE